MTVTVKLLSKSLRRIEPGQGSAKQTGASCDKEVDEVLTSLSSKYGVTSAKILLRWAVEKGYPVLPKSNKSERIIENADIFGFSIEEEDMNKLDSLDRDQPFAWPSGNPLNCD